MKQTKLILTRTALALFVLFMAQSAWAAPEYHYMLSTMKVTLSGDNGETPVTLAADDNGLNGTKSFSMVYTGDELTPTVKVECEWVKKNQDSGDPRDITGMFDIVISNNVYATGSTAADGDEATITITLKDNLESNFWDAEGHDEFVKHFIISKAPEASIYAEPKVESREYNGKPWTAADIEIIGVPEGHTVAGITPYFYEEVTGDNDGYVGVYTISLEESEDAQILLDGIDVTDCFEAFSIEESTSQMEITQKRIYIKAKDQTIFQGQDIVTGTSQVEIYKKDEASNLVPTTLAEGDVLTDITLDLTTEEGFIWPMEAKIMNGDIDVKANYLVSYEKGNLTTIDNTVIITITGHTGSFVYDGEEHTVSGYECAISYAQTPSDANVITPEMIVYTDGTASVSGTTVDDSDVMGLDAEKFGLSGYTGTLDPHFVVAADGSITITPAKVTVAIVGAKKSLAYNGDEQEVSGYTATADNAIYDVNSYIDYNGEGDEPTVAAIHAGKYWMELDPDAFVNTDDNFEVYFMVPEDGDGYLEILPINAKVTIKGKTKTAVYDGEEKTVTGWKATANTDLYHVDTDFAYYGLVDEAGNAYATLTHVLVDDEGEVIKEYMGLNASLFANVNPDFATVEFVVTDGWLEVTKRPVTITITGTTAKYEYDAEQHEVKEGDIVISDELYEEEQASAEEAFFAPKEGTASATAYAARTEIGITYMGMKAEDWENFNTDYEVTFEVTDGSVTISYHVASLADDTDNTSTIADIVADYKGMADVTLADRTLYKDGSWNTICLPFDVDIEDSPLAGADVRQLTGASYEEGTLTLEFTAVTEIKAGEPYIIKWEEGNNLVNPVFKGVEVVGPGLSEARFDIGEEMALTFKGTYAPVKYTSENKSILLVGDNSALYYPESGAFTNPQRAFFELEGIEVGDVESNAIGLRFGDATRINMQTTASDAVYYDLSGRRVVEPTTGIYIVNGKKVIVK